MGKRWEAVYMRKIKYKGRKTIISSSKSTIPLVLYNDIMIAYAKELEKNDDIVEITVNAPLSDEYMTDFVCKKRDGSLIVRETVPFESIVKGYSPTFKLLEISNNIWKSRGVADWKILTQKIN